MTESYCNVHLLEGLQGWSRELQASLPDLSAGEGYRTDYLECHHMECAGQPED